MAWLCLWVWAVAAASLKVDLKVGESGLYVAPVLLGTPPQEVWLQLDTGSAWSWVPAGNATGFNVSESSSASVGEEKSLTFADRMVIGGRILSDQLVLGDLKAPAELLLANGSQGRGLLGLMSGNQKAPAAWLRGPSKEEDSGSSVIDALWEANPGLPRTYRLDLGASPQLLLGVPGSDADEPSEVTFLGPTLTRLVDHWYVSVRAIGLSYANEGTWLRMSFDFNSGFTGAFGAAALLDTGAGALRVGAGLWERMMLGMPDGCRQNDAKAMSCGCDGLEGFPTITLSLETLATFRILGLDSGADMIVCIPPSAYVRRTGKDSCEVAIVNGGEHHTMFGMEAIVLGLPFFRAAGVLFDGKNRVVGIQPCDARVCGDPKNWWSTGRRFSPKRVVVALLIVTMISMYVFVGYSQSRTAERLRALLETFTGPFAPSDDRHTQLLQMANRNPE